MASPNLSPQSGEPNQRFESDSHKLANKHLTDPNHIITDEDLKNIRIGVTPPADEPTQQAVGEADEKVADRKLDSEEDTIPGSQKATPWDVIE